MFETSFRNSLKFEKSESKPTIAAASALEECCGFEPHHVCKQNEDIK